VTFQEVIWNGSHAVTSHAALKINKCTPLLTANVQKCITVSSMLTNNIGLLLF